jgi:hypothetical protein
MAAKRSSGVRKILGMALVIRVPLADGVSFWFETFAVKKS